MEPRPLRLLIFVGAGLRRAGSFDDGIDADLPDAMGDGGRLRADCDLAVVFTAA
jgi:hypothetical protein